MATYNEFRQVLGKLDFDPVRSEVVKKLPYRIGQWLHTHYM
jgi:hypothetical protein